MKRIFLTLLAFFYLAVASGASVNFHYCMGELVDWSLAQSNQHACSFCGMEKKKATEKSCCKDVQHQAKVDHAQKADTQIYKFQQSVFVIPSPKPLEVDLFPVFTLFFQQAPSNAPPLGKHLPIFIKNCTYRI